MLFLLLLTVEMASVVRESNYRAQNNEAVARRSWLLLCSHHYQDFPTMAVEGTVIKNFLYH